MSELTGSLSAALDWPEDKAKFQNSEKVNVCNERRSISLHVLLETDVKTCSIVCIKKELTAHPTVGHYITAFPMDQNVFLKSRYRTGYIIQSVFLGILLLLMAAPFFYIIFAFELTIKGLLLNIGIIVFLLGIPIFYASRLIYQLGLSSEQMEIRGIIKKRIYKYGSITSISTMRHTLKKRFYSSPGYEILRIKFNDGRLFQISANVSANYSQLKSNIYANRH